MVRTFNRKRGAYNGAPARTDGVTRLTPNEKLNGEIVELRGRLKGQNWKTALGAKGRVLVTDHL